MIVYPCEGEETLRGQSKSQDILKKEISRRADKQRYDDSRKIFIILAMKVRPSQNSYSQQTTDLAFPWPLILNLYWI
jgi:hypothetical protein